MGVRISVPVSRVGMIRLWSLFKYNCITAFIAFVSHAQTSLQWFIDSMLRRAPRGAETANFAAGPPAGENDSASAAWDAFWGWDCCAPGGLCERLYAHLGISESSWPALKMLPAVSMTA